MPQVTTTLSNITLPIAHESSRLRSPRDSDDGKRQWKRTNRSNQQLDSIAKTVNNLTREVKRRRILGGASPATSDFKWQTPYKELDMTKAVKKGTFVFVSTGNELVTAGVGDVYAVPGIWQARVDVPAYDAELEFYDVPTLEAEMTPTGGAGALQGSLDAGNLYWIFWRSGTLCRT